MSNPFDPLPADTRYNAYYFSFEPTGVGVIDQILSEIACAGKGSHHTDSWSEPNWGNEPSYASQIQAAADKAAEEIRKALNSLK